MSGRKRSIGWAQITVLTISILVSTLAAEGLTRLFLNPVDYLVPEVLPDAERSLRIRPFSAGHDAGGYRNPSVPKQADIVVVGDSQTYGVSTPAARSWPRTLERLTGHTLYSLAVPGYNPVDYYSLVTREAFAFHPRVLLVAVYYGNDLREAFRSVYGKERWKELRDPRLATAEILAREAEDAVVRPEPPRPLGAWRDWLARHSILYRMATEQVRERLRLGPAKANGLSGEAVIFEDPSRRLHTILTPAHRLGVLDLDDVRVADGLRITLTLLLRMKEKASANHVPMFVVLLPTKESVFWPMIQGTPLAARDDLRMLVERERAVNERMTTELKKQDLPFVEVLGDLRRAAAHEEIYPYGDGHPNANGCAVIAARIKAALDRVLATGCPAPPGKAPS